MTRPFAFLLHFVLAIAGLSATAFAQTIPYGPNTPALTGYGFTLTETREGVMRRATDALRAAGLTVHAPMPEAIGGNNDKVFAIISTVSLADGKQFVTIAVASDKGDRNEAPRVARFLRDRMQGLPTGGAEMPIGTWRRESDGLEIEATWDGTTLRQTISKLEPLTSAAGFQVGEHVGEFRLTEPNKMVGRGKWRVGGREEWRDMTMDIQNATTMVLSGGGGVWTWRRVGATTSTPPPTNVQPLTGLWRRDGDGLEVVGVWDGPMLRQTIAFADPMTAAAGFTVGEAVGEFRAAGTNKFTGRGKWRVGGREEWRDLTAELQNPNTALLVGGGGAWTWRRITHEPIELAGTWRRESDGSEVAFSRSGEGYAGHISKNVPALEAAGFRVGEQTFSATRQSAARFVGKIKFRGPGGEEWVDGAFVMESANVMVGYYRGFVERWIRASASQPTTSKAPLVGLWRRDGDGLEVRATWNGDTYVQHIAKLVGNMADLGFSVGQSIGEFKQSAADRMSGRGLFRRSPGVDSWHDGTIKVEGPNNIVIDFPGLHQGRWQRIGEG